VTAGGNSANLHFGIQNDSYIVFIGPLDDDLRFFLNEVEQIVHDSYFKVRSFALETLAKEIWRSWYHGWSV
jgi:hypothetical protein